MCLNLPKRIRTSSKSKAHRQKMPPPVHRRNTFSQDIKRNLTQEYARAHTHLHERTRTQKRTHTCTRARTHTNVCPNALTHTHSCTRSKYVYTQRNSTPTSTHMKTSTHTNMYTHTHTYMHTHTHTHRDHKRSKPTKGA